VLDLMINAGGSAAPNGLTAAQGYMTYTHQLIQNARVSSIGSSCVPTSTVTNDGAVFDSVMQNEVCIGPNPCTFRGVTVGPGSFAYTSGALFNCPLGCPDPDQPPPQNQSIFRIALVGLCAIAPGQAVFHWQFSPPAPVVRDTEIVNTVGEIVNDPVLYTDYVINIVAPTNTPTSTPTNTFTPTVPPTRTPAGNALHFLQPGTAGNCPAPPNGGTTTVGCRFVLNMMINAGSSPDSCAQQGYLQVPYQLIKNARVNTIASACTLTNTVTADFTVYEAAFQNEICNGTGPNGDQPCIFRGVLTAPGSYAFASGAMINEPSGGIFRVAQIGLCAVAPGQAVLHWQFSPPYPITRDSEILDTSGNLINDPLLYTDYVINILPPSVIVGHVNWQGAPAQPNSRQMQPVTLTLKLGTTEANFPSQNTDSSGYVTFTLPILPNGTYDWRVKGPKFLASAGNVALTGAPTTGFEAGLQRAGDADNNNVVNISDFNILKNSFGKMVGDPGYDARADFNNDNIVNAQDTNLHKINQGMSGPPPLNPGK
jgi:hypothetical protein